MSRATILYLHHTSLLGGAEQSLAALAGGIDRDRFEPVALLPDEGPLAERLRRAGVEVEIVPLAPAGIRRPAGVLSNTRAILAVARTRGADLIHANNFHAIKLAAPVALLSKLPLVGSIRDIVPFTYPTRRAIASCDRIVCVSRAAAANLEQGLGRAVKGKLSVIPTGVDVDALRRGPARDEARRALGFDPDDGPVAGVIAPLLALKGQDVFLEAASKVAGDHPRARFVIAGGDDLAGPGYVERLRTLSVSEGLEGRVSMLGFVDDVREVLAAVDVVVCPSTEPDALPRSALEAMAVGRPVVASRIGGLPEAVDDGVTGVLVPPGDVAALASAIHALFGDPARRGSLGSVGSEAATARFSITAHCSDMAALYDDLL